MSTEIPASTSHLTADAQEMLTKRDDFANMMWGEASAARRAQWDVQQDYNYAVHLLSHKG